ncbi:MAG: DUF3108 domain-containing protein [Rariglobus sp.]
MNLPRCLLALFFLVAAARADEKVALLQPGEALTYRVGWGLFGHAGEMTIAAQSESSMGRPAIRIVTTSATRGLVRLMYSFDGDAWTLFDSANGNLLSASASTRSSKESTHASIDFNYEKREANYVDHLKPSRSTLVPLPEGKPLDLMTALIQTRIWGLQPGQSRDVLVLFDDEFYALRITAVKEESVSTPQGKRKAVLLVPSMIGRPKGMFRRGGEVRVWVSADDEHLPLRFEVKLKVGTGYAVLTDYRAAAEPSSKK